MMKRKKSFLLGIELWYSIQFYPALVNVSFYVLFSLWLYSRILGLGRLHETLRFISITRSRTVDWTPWSSDQLVTRPLLTALGDCDDGEVDFTY
jgi:hypothetical protein